MMMLDDLEFLYRDPKECEIGDLNFLEPYRSLLYKLNKRIYDGHQFRVPVPIPVSHILDLPEEPWPFRRGYHLFQCELFGNPVGTKLILWRRIE